MEEETSSTGLSGGSQFDFLKTLMGIKGLPTIQNPKTDETAACDSSWDNIGDELRDEVDLSSLTNQGVYLYKKQSSNADSKNSKMMSIEDLSQLLENIESIDLGHEGVEGSNPILEA